MVYGVGADPLGRPVLGDGYRVNGVGVDPLGRPVEGRERSRPKCKYGSKRFDPYHAGQETCPYP